MASIVARGKKNKLYIRFRYHKREMCEPSIYFCLKNGEKDCACKQCKAASAYALEIERKIDDKTFIYAQYFPRSKALISMGLSQVSVDGDIHFTSYAQQWLDFKEPVTTFSTYKGYKYQVKVLKNWLNLLVKDIKPAHIRNMVKGFVEYGLSPKTIKNIVFMLNNILSQAKDDYIIDQNPCVGITLPKVKQQQPDPFSREEVELVLDAIGKSRPELQAFFAIGFYTGMRTGEILALTWGDIDFNKHKIRVSKTLSNGRLKEGTKTNKTHDVDIIQPLDPYLNKHKQYTLLIGGALFMSTEKAPVKSYQTIVRAWKPVLMKLGIRYRQPYQMRHTFACMMLAAGEDPNWVKDMLGHSTLEMLFKIYGNWYQPPKNVRAGAKFSAAEN